MSQNFKLSTGGDLVLTNGNLVLVDDVAQRIRTRLRMLLGEWFLNTSDGTPYMQQILIKNFNLAHVRSAFQARILGTEGVKSIQSMTLSADTIRRKLTVSCVVVGPSGIASVIL